MEQDRAAFDPGGEDARWPTVEQHLLERYRADLAAEPNSPLSKALFVVVEKIQGGKERIPESWAVHGTTGYRFANAITGLFVGRALERDFNALYARFSGYPFAYEALLSQRFGGDFRELIAWWRVQGGGAVR